MKQICWLVLGGVCIGLMAACAPPSEATPGATLTPSSALPLLTPTLSLGPIHTATTVPSATASPAPTATSLTAMPATASPAPTLKVVPTTKPTPFIPATPIFGVGMEVIGAGGGLDLVSQAGAHWVRSNQPVAWAEVEPTEGARNWSALANLEEEFRNASSRGMQVIQVVRVTPAWAQKIPGATCSAIKPEKLGAFAAFMRDLVARYSVAPYRVKHWEIWNEPDIDPSLVLPTSDWGCWGDAADAYYGGGYYAQMLKLVYPQIKTVDPQARVLVGGLLLDCDPRRPPQGKDCKPARFLEGILRNNGAPFFDGVSFHGYDYYGAWGTYGNSNWNSFWNTSGPIVIAKTRFIKELLAQYGATGKMLLNTESALICAYSEPECQTPEFQTTKAYFVAQLYAAAVAEGLDVSMWYSVLGWRASGLVNAADHAPLPALDAYRFAVKELRGARFLRELKDYPGVRVYEYETDSRRVWLLWSLDGAEHSIRFPVLPHAVFDVSGRVIKPDDPLRVTVGPCYVEWEK